MSKLADENDHRAIDGVSFAMDGQCGFSDDIPKLRQQIERGESRDKMHTACEIAVAFMRWSQDLKHENAALRAQVERLEGEKLRLREVVKESHEEFSMVQIHGKKWPVRGTMRKLAAVLRETDVDTETGRE